MMKYLEAFFSDRQDYDNPKSGDFKYQTVIFLIGGVVLLFFELKSLFQGASLNWITLIFGIVFLTLGVFRFRLQRGQHSERDS